MSAISTSTIRATFLSNHIHRVDGDVPNPMLSKHAKMAISPFAFYRGTAQLFYADLQQNTITIPDAFSAIPLTCITGDCHLSNFGFITEEGSHGDNVIFAPNDFDDACVGLAHWDIVRFMTSLALSAEYCQGICDNRYSHPKTNPDKAVVTQTQINDAMKGFIQEYADTCQSLHKSSLTKDSAIESVPEDHTLYKAYTKACKRAAGAEQFLTKSALAKAVYMTDNGLQFIRHTDKFSTVAPHYYRALAHAFSPYMDDEIIDIVQRNNAGTGSVDMARYYFLVGPAKPHNTQSFSRCHIVEVKQQREAAPLYYFPDLSPVNRLNPAHLTARCQRKMQRRPDLLLDEAFWQSAHYLVRSRHHARVGVSPQDVSMGNNNVSGGCVAFAKLCARALALAHARGDRRSSRFEQQASVILPDNADALINCAVKYARQVVSDYQWFVSALKERGISSTPGR